MVRRKGVIILASLILVTFVVVTGIFILNRHVSKKVTTINTPVIDNAELRNPVQQIQDLNTVKEAYNQKDYESTLARAKIIYDNDTEDLDFKLAALGYCVRSLKALSKDTTECQTKADELLKTTSGVYREFLLDTFNAKVAQ